MKIKHDKNRKFANEWDDIRDLYDRLLYWLYRQEDARKARPLADQLERLLPKADPTHDAIFGEECWSLVYEAKENLEKAISHRENEIDLIRRLHVISRNQPHENAATSGYEFSDLSDRPNLLATLYHDRGDLDKAIRTLDESKRLCAEHGIPFDGVDILREYSEEKPSTTDS
jgi:tetratricopeptide (TPR) repeat protein